MKFAIAAACLTLFATSVPGEAVPSAPVSEGAQTIVIPFDPPLGEPLRYRSETTRINRNSSITHWSVADYTFEESKVGYRLTVVPVDMGSNDTRAAVVETYRKLGELMAKPYVVNLSEGFEVIGVQNAGEYWQAIFTAVEEAVAAEGVDGKPASPEAREGLAAMIKMLREMPEEVRLAKLTEDVQPMLEFGLTEWTKGESVSAELESAGPFGGTLKRNVNITLVDVVDGIAAFSLYSLVPPAELRAMLAAFFAKIPASTLKPEDAEKLQADLEKSETMTLEERSNYRVSTADGTLLRYQFSKKTEIKIGGDQQDRLETRLIQRVD